MKINGIESIELALQLTPGTAFVTYLPAGRHEVYAPSAADGLVGQRTVMRGMQGGLGLPVEIVGAEVIEDGKNLRLTWRLVVVQESPKGV